MENRYFPPDVLDFAYQIISMDKHIQNLERELDHYKKLNEINESAVSDSIKNSNDTIGIVLNAILDPESNINKADRILMENELKID